MNKIRWWCFWVLIGMLPNGSTQAQMLLIMGENRSTNVDVVNATDLTFQVVESMTATSDFGPITGIFGMSLHPQTGELYVVYQSGSASSRRLGIMDQSTAAITDIGNCGNIIDIAFGPAGDLFGTTGNMAPDYSFVLIDLVTAAQLFLFDHTPSSYGGGMAYNPFTDEIYYQNFAGTSFIDPGTFIETVGSPIGSPGETQAMIILSPTLGWMAHYGTLYSFDPQTEIFSNTGQTINGYHAFSFTNAPKPFITAGNSVTVTMSNNGNPTPFDLILEAVDQQNDPLTWSLLTPPSNGMATAAGSGSSVAVDYEPNVDYVGTDSFVVQVSDGVLTDTIAVNVIIERAAQLPAMQTLTGQTVLTCPQDNTLTLAGSEAGFDYYLRNDADQSVVAGPTTGTGSTLDFQTGIIDQTSAYHVFGANPSFALNFDGLDDDVVIAHSSDFDFTDGLTIEAWVRPDDITVGFQEIFRKENNGSDRILLSFQDNGTVLSFGIETTDDGYTELDIPINPADYNNQWVHIVATFDDPTNAMRLYRNGVELGNKASNGAMQTAASPSSAHMGSNSGAAEFFAGQIAALRLWNNAPSTQTEVDDLLRKGQANLFTGLEPGLVAYYAFFAGIDSVLYDATNDNYGNINGAMWTSGINGGVGAVVSNTLRLFCPVYVDLNAAGADDGSSWANAFDAIQEGVDAVAEGGLILVAEGTYMITDEIAINHPLIIRGGFPTGGGIQDIDNHPTTIDAFETITANRQRVMLATHVSGELYLEGLTLQNGFNLIDGMGGAINTTGDLSLNRVTLKDHYADVSGGGIYTQSGHVTLNNSRIIDNSAAGTGGGIHTESGDVVLIKSLIGDNQVLTGTHVEGGGIYSSSGNITVVNSRIRSNLAISQISRAAGGGLFTNSGQIHAVNSLVDENQAISEASGFNSTAEGGGIQTNNGTVQLINSAVIANSAISQEAAIGGGVLGSTSMHNSLLWNNTISEDGGVNLVPSEHEGVSIQTDHSLIKGVDLTADNGLDATDPGFDPLFTDELTGDFTLQLGSPLIDAGDFNLLPADDFDVDGDADLTERIPLDLDDMTRETGLDVDIGPFEFQTEYLVGGQLIGLLPGNAITLQNNGTDDLILMDNGAFVFATPVQTGDDYEVTVLHQPNDPIQPCVVSNASGTISSQDVTDVIVTCEMGDDLIFRDGFAPMP